MYLYVRYKHKWDEIDYSVFSTFNFVIHIIGNDDVYIDNYDINWRISLLFLGTIFSLTFFSKFLKVDDAVLGAISSISKILSGFVYAFAPTPTIFYLGKCVATFQTSIFQVLTHQFLTFQSLTYQFATLKLQYFNFWRLTLTLQTLTYKFAKFKLQHFNFWRFKLWHINEDVQTSTFQFFSLQTLTYPFLTFNFWQFNLWRFKLWH